MRKQTDNKAGQNGCQEKDSTTHGWCSGLGLMLLDIFVHLLTCDTSLMVKTNKGRNADDS